MDKASAGRTMHCYNFRPAILNAYQRSSRLVSISGIRSGKANMETLEIAAMSIDPCSSSSTYGCLFEISEEDLAPYIEREHRYTIKKVNVIDAENGSPCSAYTVVSRTDEDYLMSMEGGEKEMEERVGQYYKGALWARDDIFPLRDYTNNVIKAAHRLGGDRWMLNVLDESFLSDRKTTLREYYQKYPDRLDDGFEEEFLRAET